MSVERISSGLIDPSPVSSSGDGEIQGSLTVHGTLNSEYLVTHTTVSQYNSRVNNYITDYTIGQNPANNVYGNFLKDKNGQEIAQCVSSIDTDGSYRAGFWCNHNVEGNTTANGKWYLYVRTTPTAAYTYNFTPTSLYNNSAVDYTKPDETQGSAGSNIHQLSFRDKNLITCGLLECFSLNSSSSTTNLQSNRMTMRTYNNGKSGQIHVEVDSAGVVNTYAPNPAAGSNSTNIATTAWCRNNVSLVPSNTFTALTLQASGTKYTAPSNGYVQLNKFTNTANRFMRIYNPTSGLSQEIRTYHAGAFASINFPVAKGDKFVVSYDMDGKTDMFRFIPAK